MTNSREGRKNDRKTKPHKYHLVDGLRLEAVDQLAHMEAKTRHSRRHSLDRAKLREVQRVNAERPATWLVWLDWSMIEDFGINPYGMEMEFKDDIAPWQRLLRNRMNSISAYYPELQFTIRRWRIFAQVRREDEDLPMDPSDSGWVARNERDDYATSDGPAADDSARRGHSEQRARGAGPGDGVGDRELEDDGVESDNEDSEWSGVEEESPVEDLRTQSDDPTAATFWPKPR